MPALLSTQAFLHVREWGSQSHPAPADVHASVAAAVDISGAFIVQHYPALVLLLHVKCKNNSPQVWCNLLHDTLSTQ
jgi:hypothetical protein